MLFSGAMPPLREVSYCWVTSYLAWKVVTMCFMWALGRQLDQYSCYITWGLTLSSFVIFNPKKYYKKCLTLYLLRVIAWLDSSLAYVIFYCKLDLRFFLLDSSKTILLPPMFCLIAVSVTGIAFLDWYLFWKLFQSISHSLSNKSWCCCYSDDC